MHFSIPDTQELSDSHGSTFVGYNINVNGVFHCTVRYKQIYHLYEQLKKEFGNDRLPMFPPKKILPLTGGQLEERRMMLEKFIQIIGQDQEIVTSELVTTFLLSAQLETTAEEKQEVQLDIYTFNNYQIPVRVYTTDRTEQVLLKICKHINLPLLYASYFSLYMINKLHNGDITIVHKFQDFESPYISQKSIHENYKIVLRKSYWDMEYDAELMTDPVALNLLYTQSVCDVERSWILCRKDVRQQLAHLQAKLAKREYIELAQTLYYYGYMQFSPCHCDYPKPQTEVLVAIGNQELSLRLVGKVVKEGCFKVTRMRCWRITATQNKQNNPSNSRSNSGQCLELSFEYLMAKDKLQWITITSDQSIMMSVCLQSMVDELLLKKIGQRKRKSLPSRLPMSFMKRDGSSHTVSLEHDDIFSNTPRNGGDSQPSKFQESFSIKKLQEKFSSVSFKTGKEFVENKAFEGIGDDDL